MFSFLSKIPTTWQWEHSTERTEVSKKKPSIPLRPSIFDYNAKYLEYLSNHVSFCPCPVLFADEFFLSWLAVLALPARSIVVIFSFSHFKYEHICIHPCPGSWEPHGAGGRGGAGSVDDGVFFDVQGA